jgi:hypothetical protein
MGNNIYILEYILKLEPYPKLLQDPIDGAPGICTRYTGSGHAERRQGQDTETLNCLELLRSGEARRKGELEVRYHACRGHDQTGVAFVHQGDRA